MNCPNCNKPLSPNQKFCHGCGTRIQPLTEPADDRTMSAETPTKLYDRNKTTASAEPAPQAIPQEVSQEIPPVMPQHPIQVNANAQDAAQDFSKRKTLDTFSVSNTLPDNYSASSPNEVFPEYPRTYGDSFSQSAAEIAEKEKAAETGVGTSGSPVSPVRRSPKKSRLILIIIIVVLAALLVGGGVFWAMKLMDNKGGDNQEGQSAETSFQLNNGTTESSKDESGKDTSSKAESSKGDASSSAGGHAVVSHGVTLAEDEEIQTGDRAAEQKIQNYVNSEDFSVPDFNNMQTDAYAKGNALVYEITAAEELDSLDRGLLIAKLKIFETSERLALSSTRESADVDTLVVVIAAISKDGELIQGSVVK